MLSSSPLEVQFEPDRYYPYLSLQSTLGLEVCGSASSEER